MARLFLNQPCPVCDRPTPQTFCLDCDRQLAHAYQTFQNVPLSVAKNVVAENSLLYQTARQPPVISLGAYDGALKRAILAMKYDSRPDVAYPLGIALSRRWQQASASQQQRLFVLPIPLHTARQKSRGYNQAERIAASFCKASGLIHLPHGLQRIKATQPQHSLGLNDRQKNLEQVFRVGNTLLKFAERPHQRKNPPAVLLIDDIYTTGATAQSAVAALQDAGFSVSGIAVLARAMQK